MASFCDLCEYSTVADRILSYFGVQCGKNEDTVALMCTSKYLLKLVGQREESGHELGESASNLPIQFVYRSYLHTILAAPNDFEHIQCLRLPDRGTTPRDPVSLSSQQQTRLFDCEPYVKNIRATVGWGVMSGRVIPRDSLLFPYYGEFISTAETNRRHTDHASNKVMNYILTIREHIPASDTTAGGILVSNIDASKFGSLARFVNHSCDPNACMVMLRRPGEVVGVPVLKTIRTIAPGQQITFSYGGSDLDQQPPEPHKTKFSNINADTVLGKRAHTQTSTNGDGRDASSGSVEHDVDCVRKRCFCGAARCSGYLPSHL